MMSFLGAKSGFRSKYSRALLEIPVLSRLSSTRDFINGACAMYCTPVFSMMLSLRER